MLVSAQWYVYTITRFEVILVKVDKPIDRFVPFTCEYLFEHARLISFMPVDRFIRVVMETVSGVLVAEW